MEKSVNEGVHALRGKRWVAAGLERALMPDMQQKGEEYASFIEAG